MVRPVVAYLFYCVGFAIAGLRAGFGLPQPDRRDRRGPGLAVRRSSRSSTGSWRWSASVRTTVWARSRTSFRRPPAAHHVRPVRACSRVSEAAIDTWGLDRQLPGLRDRRRGGPGARGRRSSSRATPDRDTSPAARICRRVGRHRRLAVGTSLSPDVCLVRRRPDRRGRCSRRRSAPTSSAPSRHGDNEALVECATGRRWTYARVRRRRQRRGARPARRRHREGRPGRDLGAELRRVDAHPVRHREGRRDPGQHQPGLPDPRAVLRGQPERPVALLVAADSFKTSDYRAMVDEVRGRSAQTLRAGGLHRHAGLGRRCVSCRRGPARRRPAPSGWPTLEADDPINIQYTSGTTGFPKGATLSHRNILNNGYFVTELINFTADDRLAIPVPFYHCFGMVMGNLGCTTHGATMVIPAPAFDPGATLRAIAGRAVHRRLRRARRCSSRCRTTRLRVVRPVARCAPG